jgi:hypothetical protein
MPLRIGLLNLPELVADVVRSAFEPGEADVEQLPGATAIAARTRADGPGVDAVIAGVQDASEPEVLGIASTHRGLLVLGLRTDGRQTWIYELVPRPRALGELGPAQLRSSGLAAVQTFAT